MSFEAYRVDRVAWILSKSIHVEILSCSGLGQQRLGLEASMEPTSGVNTQTFAKTQRNQSLDLVPSMSTDCDFLLRLLSLRHPLTLAEAIAEPYSFFSKL